MSVYALQVCKEEFAKRITVRNRKFDSVCVPESLRQTDKQLVIHMRMSSNVWTVVRTCNSL